MPQHKIAAAAAMRLKPTPAEALLWAALKGKALGFKARRQAPMWGYIADFYIPSASLIIEVDGAYHLDAIDALRDSRLMAHGIRTIRFKNEEVIHRLPAVLERITKAASAKGKRSSKNAQSGLKTSPVAIGIQPTT